MFWAILVTVLFIIFFGIIKVEISTVVRKRTFYVVKITFCGIKVYGMAICFRMKGYNIQALSVKKGGYKIMTDVKSIIESVKNGEEKKKVSARLVFSAVRFDSGELRISLGTGDAAATALLCGTISNILRSLAKIKHMDDARITAEPNFERKEFSVRINCIFTAFLAQIIYEFIK